MTEGDKTAFVFGHNIALEVAVMQVKADVFKREARSCEMLYRKFKKLHIVGLLMYFGTVRHQALVNFKKSRMGKAVSGIAVFGKRTGEVQKYSGDTFLL